jgi:transcriptional regulator with XRE-family HTH domain
MKNQLKKFRVEAGKIQEEVARAVGVTQPNYYRWESSVSFQMAKHAGLREPRATRSTQGFGNTCWNLRISKIR